MIVGKTKSVFGPVPSRRLGRSLGVDLLPYKTCSLDCVYCECGATTNLTCERKEYFPTDAVLQELDAVLAQEKEPIDYLTFSGVGEPTLHSGIGTIIRHVKKHAPDIRICLLTNATLLGRPDVIEDLKGLDVVVPSLDASNEDEFRKINRPHASLTLENLVRDIQQFKKRNPARMWLELFLIPRVNVSRESALRFRTLIEEIMPDKVQLNSLDRPGTEKGIGIPTAGEFAMFREILSPVCPTEIISRSGAAAEIQRTDHPEKGFAEYNDSILKTLRSRPCTAADLAQTYLLAADQLEAHLRRMERAGLIVSEEGPRGRYYRPAQISQ